MRLSEFKDEKGIEVVAQLLVPISKIVSNKENAAIQKRLKDQGGSMLDFASAMLRNSPRAVMDMLAILDGKDPEHYHCSAATALRDVFNMLSDPELLSLFGLQSQTPVSSGSASESTGVPAAQHGSSATPAQSTSRPKKKKRSRST